MSVVVLDRAQAVVGWVAVGAALMSVIPGGSVQPYAFIAASIVIFALFCAQMLIDLFDTKGRAWRGAMAVPAVLFVGTLVWAALQLSSQSPAAWHSPAWSSVDADGAVAVDPDLGRQFLARLAMYAMLFWIAARAAADEARAKAFVRVIAVWSAIAAVYALVAYVARENPLVGVTPGVATGSFVNRNHFATYSGFGMLAAIAALILTLEGGARAASARHRIRATLEGLTSSGWIFLLCIAVNLAAITLSQSRAGILVSIAGILAFVLVRRQADGTSRVKVAAVLAVLAVAYAGTIGLGSVLNRFQDADLAGGRDDVYLQVASAIADRPVLGVGLGGFPDTFLAYLPESADVGGWDTAHNSYLENAMELGLPAAIAMYIALALIVWRLVVGVGVRRRSTALPAFTFAVAVLAGLHSLVDFSLQIPAVAALFAIILGIGWVQSFGSRERAASAGRE